MNSKIKTIVVASLFLLALTSFRIIWLIHFNTDNHPKVEQGILDLRNTDELNTKTIRLDGEWKFYPELLLTSGEQTNQKTHFIPVPDNWKKHFPDGKDNGYGYGTYYLKILVPKDKNLDYEIRALSIRTASKFFVNGEEIAANGIVSDNPQIHEGDPVPIRAKLKATENGEIELFIQVSNYDHLFAGGIAKSIIFGSAYAVNKEIQLSVVLQLVLFVIMVIHSLYAFILFSLRPKRKELLYFALGTLFYSLSIILDDDRLILSVVPLNYEWYYKLIKVSYIGTAAFLLQFINHLFFKDVKMKIVQYVYYLCITLGIVTILFPLKYLFFANYHSIIVSIAFLLMAILMFKFVILNKDALLVLLAVISVISSLGWGIIKTQAPSYFPVFYPFDLILAIILFSSFWFKKFFQESEEKEELASKLQEEDKRKDQFLANASHELRNPLHGIINIAESIVNNKKEVPDDMKENLELLVTISRRMSLLLNDFIDMTRLSEKRYILNKQSVNIKTIVFGVFDMFKFMIEKKNIQFAIDIPDDFNYINADKNRLIQILYNLIHNAVKFTDEGIITVKVRAKHSFAYIQVIDTGIGMTNETQSRVFLPYEQGNTTTEGGLGLGLSICKQLVEMHGGILTVDSVPGQGSIFTFSMPLVASSEDDDNQIEEFETDHHHTKEQIADRLETSFTYEAATEVNLNIPLNDRPKILAVDDDAINLRVLSNILSSNQFDLVTVTSGQEALRQLNKREWDLIIADVMMPTMSGYELSRRIREQFSISELPILLLTARSHIQDIVTGFLSGANDYISKPVNSLELKARVSALSNVKQSIGERLRMEAAWLQAQIQPHFLYNTLNTIVSLSGEDNDRMTTILHKFGQYLQKSFDPVNLERVVPLKHELELLEAYLYIEKERFGKRLNIKWEMNTETDLLIPPLSIQTLVENAIRHGVLKKVDGGTILIKVTSYEGHSEVIVQDDGIGMNEEKITEILSSKPGQTRGIGIVNTNKRLKQTFGTELNIFSTPGQGTTVMFNIPNSK